MFELAKRSAIHAIAIAVVCVGSGVPPAPAAVVTAFSYQGKLTDAGNPANSNYDMMFRLYDTPTVGTGSQHGPDQPRNGVVVTAGIFGVTLDFGNQYGFANNIYLEIGVRPAGSGNPYSFLPRQPLLASPYAVETLNAQFLGNLPASQYVATDGNGNVALGDTPSGLMRLHIVSNAGQSPPRAISIGGVGGFTAGWDFFHLSTPKGFVGAPDSNAPLGANEMILFGSTGVTTSLWAGGGRALTIDPSSRNVGIGINPDPNAKLSVSNGNGLAAYANAGSGYGFWGAATSNGIGVYGTTASGIGVQGLATTGAGISGSSTSGDGVSGSSSSGSGVYGTSAAANSITNAGVYGIGTGSGGIGVHGEASNANSVGVFGTSTSVGGVAVYARNATGRALYVEGNAGQTLQHGGLVKFMVRTFQDGTIRNCYNGLTNASTGNCGFTVLHGPAGTYRVQFGAGIDVSNRFVALSARNNDAALKVTGSWRIAQFNANEIEVNTYIVNTDAPCCDDAEFVLLVY